MPKDKTGVPTKDKALNGVPIYPDGKQKTPGTRLARTAMTRIAANLPG